MPLRNRNLILMAGAGIAVGVSLLLLSCGGREQTGTAAPASASSTKFQQYFIKGEELYIKHCSNCHQKTGTGLGLLYPPLNKSDFMDNHLEEVLCLMKYGREGELIVNGKSYNKKMPGIPLLTDLEVAEIATYIYNQWDHQRGLIDVKDAASVLSKCDRP